MPTIFRKKNRNDKKSSASNCPVNGCTYAQFSPPILSVVGREEETLKILEILNRYNFVVLGGRKYVGKTAIACEIARKRTRDFESIIYLDCVEWNENEIMSSFCDLLSSIQGTPVSLQAMHTVFFEILNNRKILFIFDNVSETFDVFSRLITNILKQVSNNFVSKVIVIKSHSDNSKYTFKKQGWYYEIPGITENDVILLGENESICISNEEAATLVHRYNGCPIYIQIVLDYCKQYCNSNVKVLLESPWISIGSIENLLKEQFDRLPVDAQDFLYYTVLFGEKAQINELRSYLKVDSECFHKIITLLSEINFIAEVSGTDISLALPIKELLQKNIENIVCEEIYKSSPAFLKKFPLLMNHASEEVKTYQRYIIKRILSVLCSDYAVQKEMICNTLLNCIGNQPYTIEDQLVGNIINLMALSSNNICNVSFANSYINNANFENVELQNVDFSNAKFENCSFKNIFGSVTAMSYNQEHELLATAFFNGLIFIWDKHGNQKTILMEFNNSVNSILFFSNKLFACGKDGRIVEWQIDDYYNYEISREYYVNSSPIRTIAYSEKHNRLFAGSEDGTVKIWNLATNEQAAVLCQKGYRIKSISISPNQERLAIGGDNEQVTIYKIADLSVLLEVTVENRWIRCLSFYDDATLICGGDLGNINIIDITHKTCETIKNVDKNKIWSITSIPSQGAFVVGGNSGTIKIFDMQSKKVVYILQKHSSWIRCLEKSGDYLYSGSEDQTICIWNLSNYRCLKVICGYTKRVFAIDSNNGKLYAGLGDHSVVEIDTEKETISSLFNCSDQVWTISTAGSLLCAGCDKGDIYIYDLDSHRILFSHHFDTGWIGTVTFSQNGEWLAVGDEFGTIYIFNTKNKYMITQANKYHAHNGRVASALFVDDMIVSAGEDGAVVGFDYRHKKKLFMVKVSDNLLYTIGKLNDGEYLAGGSDGKIYLVDIINEIKRELVSLNTPIWSIKVIKGNTFLLGTDSGIMYHYTTGGILLDRLSEHDTQIWTISVDEEQNQIITGGEDAQIIGYSITPKICMNQKIACDLPYKNVLLQNCDGLTCMQKNYLCTMGARE